MNVFKLIFIFILFQFTKAQTDSNSDIELEFDETNIKSLKLTLKWKFKPSLNRKANKYVLFYEVGRVNVFNNFSVEYSLPELLDDEEVVKASIMKRENFKNRIEFNSLSSYNCSLYCINSTNILLKNQFECNLYSYDPSIRKCVLYEYDYSNKGKSKKSRFDQNEIYESFMEECDMDEFFSEFAGYSRLCRRIMDYRNEHSVMIRPYMDFRFTLSLRDGQNKWSPFLRKEFQYSPSVSVQIIGDLKFGNDIKLKCTADLSEEIIESITWRNSPVFGDTLLIPQLTPYNLHQTYFCEIRIGAKQMIQKTFKFNVTDLMKDLKPELKLNHFIKSQDLMVSLNWTVEPPKNTKFKAEKMLLLYSKDGGPYKFLKNFFPFESSKWDSPVFTFTKENKFYNTSSEEECANECIQLSYCNFFVYKPQFDPNERVSTNCRVTSKSSDGLFPCPKFSSCQNLKNPETYTSNDTVNITILPNSTYRFKLQLRDKYLNWTDALETEAITIPLNIEIEKFGSETVSSSSTFGLKCNTNINRIGKIIWTLNDADITTKNNLFTLSESKNNVYLNSILELNTNLATNFSILNGVYKCKIIRESDESGFAVFNSEPLRVLLRVNDTLNYNQSISNITLPSLPGYYLRLDCQVSGTQIESLNWYINDQVLNAKNSFFDLDDLFVITSKINDNIPIVNRTLVIKLENPKPMNKYECILNGNLTVRSHYVEIFDGRPELEYKIDQSELNKLKLKIDLKVKNSLITSFDNNLDIKPQKISILYAENSTLINAFQTFVAPETLSSGEAKDKMSKNSEITIGHLFKTQHGIQSCKLSCFQMAFCKSYEYLMYDDSCNFYTNTEIDSFYSKIVDRIEQKNSNLNFDLIHLRDDAPKTLEEDLIYNYTILIDKKSYFTCENRTANSFSEEFYCRDKLADFKETYIMENLSPLTSYQFRIEVANAFGISQAIFTDMIQVPFKLDPIKEKEIDGKLVKLECATSLQTSDKLRFAWFKNAVLIEKSDQNFTQVDNLGSFGYKSELLFGPDLKKYSGYYTCELIYENKNTVLITNSSYSYLPTMEPEFKKFEEIVITKNAGEMLTENCSASGWPLPNVYWYFNNKPVEAKNQNGNLNPHASIHHRNYTTMSYLYAFNISKEFQGVYSCMLNGTTSIKNIKLIISGTSDKILPTDDSETLPSTDNSIKKTSNTLLIVIIGVFVLLTIVAVGFSLFILRKRQSDTNALLSYNRIEEELMTGVDNITLTDDLQ
ncbi:unnamed protein product [Brachionus calyciflorus]|uniref:Ig-like domain-containing protein n=1 Tax=Brachionus calyciflorus TaxID=104777 RepID=A0A813M2H8_9BILA|nr:unnamed protein product [Brachionus calyciflorus]